MAAEKKTPEQIQAEMADAKRRLADIQRQENRQFIWVWVILAIVVLAIGGWIKGAFWPEREELAVNATCQAELQDGLERCLRIRPENEWTTCRKVYLDELARCRT
jgi:hypothetical protein